MDEMVFVKRNRNVQRTPKSFDQCNWCVDGDIPRRTPVDGGCAAVGGHVVWPWFILGLLAWERERRTRD